MEIFIINLNSHEFVKSIKNNNNNVIQCIYSLENESFIISEEYEGNCDLCQFKFDKNNIDIVKISEVKNAHSIFVADVIQLKNGNIITGSGDRTIKVWS